LIWPSRHDAKIQHLAIPGKLNSHARSSHVYALRLPTRFPEDPLFRIDLPILVAYGIVFAFSRCHVHVDVLANSYLAIFETCTCANKEAAAKKVAELTLDSFNAGGSSFKLIISNLLFTILHIEILFTRRENPPPQVPNGGKNGA
ncbi:MAG: hypothetical protein ACLQME_20915, partial [Alphaproteobacteria bacterium]